ncbi:MAG TPA: heavy metal-associated domain-containing protein [Flavipsychrobacter sp.]|nr:heavy metal-associated domain-containing protein [Flavipsychrobacter sp.]
MKPLLTLLFLFVGLTMGYAQSKVTKIKIQAAIYCDHCKQCESCGKRLEEAIYNEKGVKRVDLDDKSNTVSIVYNETKTSPEKLRMVIAAAGFDADDVKGNKEVYATWDDCCKKPEVN